MGLHNWNGRSVLEQCIYNERQEWTDEDYAEYEQKVMRNYEESLLRKSEIDRREPK